MLAGINSLNPVTFEYSQDEDLLFNQNAFTTQQGLNIAVVNALSGAKDELIQNYSNIFLSGLVPVKNVLKLTDLDIEYTSFSTYLALSAYPNFNSSSRYLTLCATNTDKSNFIILPALSAPNDNYFCFQDIDGLNCRIYNISFDNQSTCLTVDLPALSCHLIDETPTIVANKSNIFRFNLDDNGFLKLFFIPTNGRLHAIRFVDDKLSAVDVSLYPATTGDIIATLYRNWQTPDFQNDFVYYSKTKLKDFYLDTSKTKKDIAQNYLLYYNYEDTRNFTEEKPNTAQVSFFKTKNILSNNYNVNDKLPLRNEIIQRNYTSILSRQNSELYDGNLQLNYTYFTKEYTFNPDKATKFVLPDTLYPANALNIEDSNLIRSGAYGGQSPVFSDKVTKSLNANINTVNYNEANGTYLYTWLYTNSDQTTAYWVDRFYYPQRTSLNEAFAGTPNQIFSFTSSLSNYLAQYNNQPQLQYYDIRSSLMFEPSATYYYSRVGNDYMYKVLDSIPSLSSFNIVNLQTKVQYIDSVLPQHLNYGFFVVNPDSNTSLTLAFSIETLNPEAVRSNLIIGNNFDEGVSVYKGGAKNIFTPGYFINTLTGVDFYNTSNIKTFTFDIRDYVDSGTRILDIINTGFDHVIKLFYVNSSYVPGFVDLSITGNVFNKYEFASLANVFAVGNNVKLFSKYYVDTNQIWYLAKNDAGVSTIYKFDYISNEYIGSTAIPAGTVCNSFVVKNDGTITTLSGYRGQILDNQYGVSKANDTLYMKDLSTNFEYPSLSGNGSSIFDLVVYDDKMYVQVNSKTIVFNKYKTVEHVYYSTLDSVSGVKIDFINENFKTLFASYSINLTGGLILEKYNLNEPFPVSVHYYDQQIKQQFLGEFNKPVQGFFNNVEGIGIIDPYFLSGGTLNFYTSSTPILDALTALDIDAVLAGTTDFTSYDCGLTGYLSFIGDTPITSDTTLNLFQGSALISQTFGDDISKVLTVTTRATSGTAYSIQSVKSTPGTVAVDLKLKLENGTFYNGSFRNMVIGSQYVGLDRQGFSNAFYAFNDNPFLSNNKFIHTAEAYALSSNFALPPGSKTYLKETSFNGYATNPLNDFFASSVEPCVSLVANPSSTATVGYTSGISPSIISFTSDTQPPFGSVLSGAPFQAPINFIPINSVNKFSQSDYVARVDLFSSQNSKIKQTKIIPFEANGSTHIAITIDTLEGDIVVYVDGDIAGVAQLSAGTFFTSYYLNNNFGIGMPYIDNNPALYLNTINYDGYAKGYTFSNFTAYNKALTQDEVKFDFLKNAIVDPVTFDITQGVRNNTDTITTYNKMVIPGRKSNNFKVYIKNLILSDEDKFRLNGILLNKIAKLVPLNSANIEFEYTNETSEFIPLSTS